MPKIVDHDVRRAELASAVWAVVRRDGIEHASVRKVATEAGCSPGSLRHYFPRHSDLLVSALRTVVERIEARLAALVPPPDPRRAAELVLHEILPLDDDRQAENEVWLAFTARAQVDPTLRELLAEVDGALRATCTLAIEALGVDDPAVETERLHALVDGLCLHAAIDPVALPASRLRAVITRHLDDLTS